MSDKLVKAWLDKAIEDLTVARLVLREDHTAHACFLSQQCIEKAMKGFLIAKTGKYPRVHTLGDLLVECETVDPAFNQFISQCAIVDQYYIPTRYPDTIPGGKSDGLPSKPEAEEAIKIADVILKFVNLRLALVPP